MGKLKESIVGGIAVSVAAALWGLDGVVLTPRLSNLDITYVVFILHFFPFVLMNLFLYREYKQVRVFSREDVVYFLLVAITGGALGTLAIVKALFLLNFQQLTVIVLLQKLQPVFAISLAAVLLKEKPGGRFIMWASVAIIASYFLTFGLHLPDFRTGSNTIQAVFLSLLAALCFGSSTVFSKKILMKYHFRTATFFRYGFTAGIMLFVVLALGSYQQITVTTVNNWAIFAIIGVTTGSGAIFLFYFGLRKIKAIVATICELFFPLSAIVLDYLINGNILSPTQWAGAVVLIWAIINLNTAGE